MRRFTLLATLAGSALLAYLLINFGESVRRVWTVIGWQLLPILLMHLVQVALSGAAWHAISKPNKTLPLSTYLIARWIREAVSAILPVAQVGGEIAGVRVLVLKGARAADAGAEVTVDITIEAVTQIVFTLIGLTYLAASGAGDGLVKYTVAGLLVLVLGVGILIALQRRHAFALLTRVVTRFGGRWRTSIHDAMEALYAALQFTYRHPRALFLGCGFHLLSWFAGVLEVWLIAYYINQTVALDQALIIETLGQAIRSAAFFVPSAIGVQESGLLLITSQLGLVAGLGLSLSLVKRVREIALGLPALMVFYLIERKSNRPARALCE
jgi:putative membrane protein